MECYSPYEGLAHLVKKLFDRYGEKGIEMYDKLVSEIKGPGEYVVGDYKLTVKEDELCIKRVTRKPPISI